MKKCLLSLGVLCLALCSFAQSKTYDLYVVTEGNFGTPNGDVYKVSRLDSVTKNTSGGLYQTANSSAGIDVLQDYDVFGNKAVLCGKGANAVKLAIAAFPSFDSIKTFTGIGGVQCLGKASNTKGYLSMATGSSIQMLDLTNNTLTAVSDPNTLISSYASYMVPANGYMYVAIGSKIVKIDTMNNTATTAINPGIGAVAGMQYDATHSCIWLLGKVSGISSLVKLEPVTGDQLSAPVQLTGISNAAQLRFALDKLYFLSGKSVYAYSTTSPNIPTPMLYTSSLSGNSFSFAYGKSFDVDPVTGDFALATAGNYAQPSQYEIVDGNTFQQIDTGSVAGRIANELILHTYTTPVPDTLPLPAVYAPCAVTLIPPVAMAGNVPVTGTTTDSLTYNTQGTYTVTWTFTNGNSSISHTQQVTIQDTIAPLPDSASLPPLQGQCPYTLVPPTATDNCAGTLTGTTDSLVFTTGGSYTIHWTYNDGHGNTSTQTQLLNVSCTTGISDPEPEAVSFLLYPNPAKAAVNIMLTTSRTARAYEVVIRNMVGQQVGQAAITSSNTNVSLAGYAPGIYYISLLEKGQPAGTAQKLIIR